MSPRRLNQSTHGAGRMGLVLLRQHHVTYLHPEELGRLLKTEEDEASAISELQHTNYVLDFPISLRILLFKWGV
jgi:hypothetical protein